MRRNILILHADQHRQDCIGCYGNPDVRTPWIDSLAADGVRYNQHYTVYPVCTPSRYSLLCGQYPHQHTAWNNESTLPEGIPTFPQLLREKGWRTAAVGKMHMTPTYQDVGYTRMKLAEQNGQGRFEDDYHTWLMEEGLIDAIDLTDQVDSIRKTAGQKYYDHFGAFESDLDEKHHSTSWITEQALEELEQWDPEGNNLLFVGYIKPHHPFDPPAPYSTLYQPEELALLPGYTPSILERDSAMGSGFFDYRTLSEERLRRIMANYYGTITQIDDQIGRILSRLKEKGLYEDTLIVYTSDHGEYLGYHHLLLKGNYLYEPLAKIPLIIKYPQDMARAGVSESLCENIDLTSTLLAVCGVSPSDGMRGIDLAACPEGREFAFSEGQYGTDANPCVGYMIRSRRYKLLVMGSLEQALFFDLEKDPCELENRAEDPAYAAELERHRQALIQKLLFEGVSVNHRFPQARQTRNPEKLQERSRAVQDFIRQKREEW